MALVCKRTIPTERPPLVGEISDKFADRGDTGQRIPTAVNLGFLDQDNDTATDFQIARNEL
jgi:hypothetical protein